MIQARHPSVLNPWQIYRQSKLILKHTSRAENPDWYRSPLDFDRQWHVWLDGVNVVSAVFDKRSGEWFEGPRAILPRDTGVGPGSKKAMDNDAIKGLHDSLDQSQLDAIFANFEEDDLRSLHESLARLTKGKDFGGKVKSLGFILHVADELALVDLAPEFSIDDDYEGVGELLQLQPADVMGDASLDVRGNSWRLLPYWGISEGERRSVAVQASRRFQPLFYELERYSESRNVPVMACLVSAPLEALRLAPLMLEAEDLTKQGNIVVFNYRRFSALSVLNAQGELVSMRALQHRSGQEYPAGLGEILVNTAASVGLADPLVTIANMSGVNQDELVAELSSFFASRPPMNIGLVTPSEIPELGDIAGGKVEMVMGDRARIEKLEEKAVYGDAETFKELDRFWARQDFYGRTNEELEVFPTQQDLKLLKFFGYGKFVVLAGLLGVIGWTGFEYFRTIATEAWKISKDQANTAAVTLEKLKKDRDRVQYWENVMARRSEGWLVMEVLLQLFEPDSGLIVSECSYNVEGEIVDSKTKAMPFRRKWEVRGYARPEGAESLARLSSNNFLTKRFEELAGEFGAESLKLNTDTRKLEVTMQQKQGQMTPNERFPASVARHYRNSFQINISQEFSEKDELALTMKPPVLAESDPTKEAK
ncbi:MAG: hypothetical protein KDN19_07275 [Verrucomicrobiae bacterium]|nr:hypothetical protein [Verrucomicrobiae bacterium]